MDLFKLTLDVGKKVAGGILVFFPSYFMMQQYISYWNDKKLMTKLKVDSNKKCYYEAKDNKEFEEQIKYYKNQIKKIGKQNETTTGAIFFAVCRGKISEGIDFSDDACRCVIIVGFTCAPIYDPEVLMKRHFVQ